MKSSKPKSDEESGSISFERAASFIIINLESQKKQLIIEPLVAKMSVLYTNGAIDPLTNKPKIIEYKLTKLPSKLKVWASYAQNFTNILHTKTPWLSL